MYYKIFFTRIPNEEKSFPLLGKWVHIKRFYIANFELFFMVITNKNLYNNI
jgi:hypothetical protein